MKALAFVAVAALAVTGCTAGKPLESVGTKYYELHEDVFGCPPVGAEKYKAPTRSLDAVGEKECPLVYKAPKCAGRE